MCRVEQSVGIAQAAVQSRMSIEAKRFPMRIEGHRGAGHLEPENSLKAFNKAIELGIDGVEFDVWLTKDNVPVVVHGLPGGIIEFEEDLQENIANIESEDLGNYTLKNGEKIPTLEQVLDACRGKVNLNIEIKELKEEVIEKVLILVEERDMFEQITFSSFNHYLRENLTSEVNKITIEAKVTFGYLMSTISEKYMNFPNYEITQPGDSINLDIRYFEKNKEECLVRMRQAKERDVKVKFWFPMEYADEHMFYGDLLELEVDTIITNKPITMIEYFAKEMICI